MIRLLATSAILVLTVSAAQAETATVRFGDLNISNSRDADVLADRIHQAAVKACETDKPNAGTINLFYRSGEITCERWISQRTLAKISARSGDYPRFAQR